MGGRARGGGGAGLGETVIGGRAYFCRGGNGPFHLNWSRRLENHNFINDGRGVNPFESRSALLGGVSVDTKALERHVGG